jgi:DNA topoisomerase-1
MKLVIVESPAKCSKIQGFLGSDYQVVASMGHIRSLEESLDAVGLQNDFEPRFEFIKEKSKVQKQLKDAAAGKTTVYLAADDDREGEAIAYSVALLLKLPVATTPRIVFHEITKKAILEAVASPRTLNMNRVSAQQARSQLDMMIGFTLSPILWNQVARGLSAGRCQTPALKLIIEKEEQVAKFKAASSWRIHGTWTPQNSKAPFQAALNDDLEDEESAVNYLDNRRASVKATVQTNSVRPWSANPPDPLMTSTLQQQASALYGLSPKATMQIAQKLYEAGHITYMRTDKATLSEEAVKEAQAWVTKEFGKDYCGGGGSQASPIPPVACVSTASPTAPHTASPTAPPKKGKVLKEDSPQRGVEGGAKSVAEQHSMPPPQEAHEAIRPTHIEVVEVDPDHQRVYTLIRNRTLQSVMAKALGENCTVVFCCEGEEDFNWTAKWKRTTFPGWQRIGKVASLEGDEEDAESSAASWTQALTLKPGTLLTWTQVQAHPHETKAAPRYTEATLVRELERHGIGRPSTFASLLAAVQDRGYAEITDIPGRDADVKTYTLSDPVKPLQEQVVKKKLGAEKKKLVPTELGKACLTFLQTHFHHLFDYTFTAQMERRLDQIEKGQEPWKQVLRDTWSSYKDKYQAMIVSPSKAGTDSTKIRVLNSEGLKAVMSKKGPLLLIEGPTKDSTKFYGWPAGASFQTITELTAKAHIASAAVAQQGDVIGTWKEHPVTRHTGKFGPYIKTNGINLSVTAEDTWETIQAKLEAKGDAGPVHTIKEFEFRKGPYGLYMFKPALKKKLFVTVPAGTPVEHLTEAEAAALYKTGLDTKKRRPQKN